ncbi:MAG TPA: TlpA disulfide reductase family protein [Pyrinomonadaceae bacterium]|nr:TlpA disulfide reductase family protein [Pyrinomonadaceae bacterium]
MRKTLLTIALILMASTAALSQQAQALKLGQLAPEFSGPSMDGTTYDLKQLQGKVVLLTFWSTRCQICHEEIPNLNKMAARYRGKNVVFLAVTMENEAKVEPYLKRNPFNFTIMPNSFGVFLQYADKDRAGNVNMGFPAHFLIKRDGTIALRTEGWDKAANIDTQISKLLASE